MDRKRNGSLEIVDVALAAAQSGQRKQTSANAPYLCTNREGVRTATRVGTRPAHTNDEVFRRAAISPEPAKSLRAMQPGS